MKKSLIFVVVAMFFCGLFSLRAYALSASDILSDAAVLIDADTGQVLFDKNADQRMFPASTTKIMTALLVCENARMDETLRVSEGAVSIDVAASANIALIPGEEIAVTEALYALMLPSANDAANALAEYIAGSQQEFVVMMNERAAAIGATHTSFKNAHGLDEPGHYTTPQDMAIITRYAMGNEHFRQFFGTATHTMPPTNLQPSERPFTNYQAMLVEGTYYYMPEVVGGKVGYTDAAGHTMSTAATRSGRNLICVVMHGGHRYDKFKDTVRLLEYGFEQFTPLILPPERFSPLELPALQEGVQVGTAFFRYDQECTVLLQEDVNPAAVRIRYEAPAAFDMDQSQEVLALVELEDPVDGVPVLLASLPMSRTVEIDVFPVASSSTPATQRRGLLLTNGRQAVDWRWLLALPVGIGSFIVAALGMRSRSLRRRRRARQARRDQLNRAKVPNSLLYTPLPHPGTMRRAERESAYARFGGEK